MDLPKIDNSNLWDKTYLILKDRIIQREFAPNEKLSIPDLSAQLGVSRTPIRDALNRLEMDGLVKTVSKVGTFVVAIEIDDVLDLIDTRLMIESWVVEKLPTLPEDELNAKIEKLENLLNHAAALIENEPLESFLKSNYNLQFHIGFINIANNKKNADIYLGLMNYHFWAVEHSLITKEMVMSALNQHYAILEALKCRNIADLKIAIKAHLYDAKERLIKRLQDNGGQI